MHILSEVHMKLVGIIGEALPEHAWLGPALHIGIVPIRWYRRGSCLVHGILFYFNLSSFIFCMSYDKGIVLLRF